MPSWNLLEMTTQKIIDKITVIPTKDPSSGTEDWDKSDGIIGGFILIKRLTVLFPTLAAGRVSCVNPSPFTF